MSGKIRLGLSRRNVLKTGAISALTMIGHTTVATAEDPDSGQIKKQVHVDFNHEPQNNPVEGVEKINKDLFSDQLLGSATITVLESGETIYDVRGTGMQDSQSKGLSVVPVTGSSKTSKGPKFRFDTLPSEMRPSNSGSNQEVSTTGTYWGEEKTASESWDGSAYESTVWAQSGTNEDAWLSDKVWHAHEFSWSGTSSDFGFYSGGWCYEHESNDSWAWDYLDGAILRTESTNGGASYRYKSSSLHEKMDSGSRKRTKLIVETTMHGDGSFNWWARIKNEDSGWGTHFYYDGNRNAPCV